MVMAELHHAPANVEDHCRKSVLRGKVGLEISRIGKMIACRKNPQPVGNFMIGPRLQSGHDSPFVTGPNSSCDPDAIAEAFLMHEVDVMATGVRIDSRKQHVVRGGAQLAAIVRLDDDRRAVEPATADRLDACGARRAPPRRCYDFITFPDLFHRHGTAGRLDQRSLDYALVGITDAED